MSRPQVIRFEIVRPIKAPPPTREHVFASFWLLAAQTEALRPVFTNHLLHGVAILRMNKGVLSYLPLEPEVVG